MRSLILTACAVVVADRLTKTLVERLLKGGGCVAVGSWLSIRRVVNSFRGGKLGPLLLWILVAGILLVAAQSGKLFQHPIAQAGLGAALGGAASNLVDRIRRGTVVDFLDFGWWPVFNLADVGITAGSLAALLFML